MILFALVLYTRSFKQHRVRNPDFFVFSYMNIVYIFRVAIIANNLVHYQLINLDNCFKYILRKYIAVNENK